MKKARGEEKTAAIPKGVYEAGMTNHEIHNDETDHLNHIRTDLQENGYPVNPAQKKEGE